MWALPLPYVRFACASSFFASLHLSSNHGASVFPHLFGFVGCDNFISLTTPISSAYLSIYSSTAAALWLLVRVVSCIIFCIPSMNVDSYVCAVHICADFP
jgi:hypothetical protein